MRSRLTSALLVSLLFLSFSPITFSWNALGHMVVANIAYENLKPSVKQKVDGMAVAFKQEYPGLGSFMQMAFWPDTLRSQKIDTYSRWHYIDVPFSGDGTVLTNTIDTDNAVWAITAMKDVIRNNRANPFERARFLAFFVHIAADLHQPLHTVTRISAANPMGDKGGNLYTIIYQNKRTNLHTLWDDGIGILSEEKTLDNARLLTKRITDLYPKDYFGDRVTNYNPTDWSKEGMRNATRNVYKVKEDQSPTVRYLSISKQIVQQEMALAGYRIANLLNQWLADD